MDASDISLHYDLIMKSDDREKIANIVPFGLRMQPDLKRRVEEAAKANGRSLNAEITHRLEASLQGEPQANALPVPDVEGRLSALEKAMLAMIGNISDINDRLNDKA